MRIGLISYLPHTALHIAAGRGLVKMTKLLAQVSDLNGRNKAGWTPLHLAIHNGHAGPAEVLAAAGADPRKKDHGGLYSGQKRTPEELVQARTSWPEDQLKKWRFPPKKELPPPPSPRRPECRRRAMPEPPPPPVQNEQGELLYPEAPVCLDELFWKAISTGDSPTVLEMLVDMFDPNGKGEKRGDVFLAA